MQQGLLGQARKRERMAGDLSSGDEGCGAEAYTGPDSERPHADQVYRLSLQLILAADYRS